MGWEIATVIGGSPYQGFSVAEKQKLDDDRSQLVIKFINLVVELNPSMFVMDLVPAFEWKKFSDITVRAIALIEAARSSTTAIKSRFFKAHFLPSKPLPKPFEPQPKPLNHDVVTDTRITPVFISSDRISVILKYFVFFNYALESKWLILEISPIC